MKKEEKKPDEVVVTMEDRIDAIGEEILAMQMSIIDRRSKGDKIPEAELKILALKQIDLKSLCDTYMLLKKMGRVSGKSPKTPQEFGKGVLDTIKKRETTMGSIVRNYGKD